MRFLTSILTLVLLVQPLAAASKDPIRARTGMVSAVSGIAARVGVEIMQKGGNAIDSAIAVSFALTVAWPRAGNIGGGGFMLSRRSDGATEVIDYRETAPTGSKRSCSASWIPLPRRKEAGLRSSMLLNAKGSSS